MELGGETKMNAADIVQFYELEKSEFVEENHHETKLHKYCNYQCY